MAKGKPNPAPVAATNPWRAAADRARKNGYRPGNAWETLLRRSLEQSQPQLLAELGPALPDYLAANVSRAQEQAQQMREAGMPPDVVNELVKADLLGTSD